MRNFAPRLLVTVALAALAAYAIAASTGGESGRAPDAVARDAVRRPPVVMLVLDEFPSDLLLGPNGRIDPVRYPSFAALARIGTWFPNAHTVYDSTTKAIPAILDAQRPEQGTVANYRDHPHTVYDLFGRRGYRIVRHEAATALCPPRYCADAALRRPAILPLLERGRREWMTRFIRSIRPERPSFHLEHALLPHGPHMFLPSGRQSRRDWKDPLPGMNTIPGFHDTFLTLHNQQRLIQQIAFVDRQVGRLLARLRRLRMLDDALVVVTADHGISSDVGVASRRTTDRRNVDEVAPVPLFIKAPGQGRGRIDRAYVRTIDIVPTMADVLGWRMPYRADGRSAFSRVVGRRRSMTVVKRDFRGRIRVSARAMQRRRAANVRRRLRRFGHGGFATLYSGIGPNRRLVGRTVASLTGVGGARRGGVRAELIRARELRAVRSGSLVRPNEIAGVVRGGGDGQRREIAVAVNGRIEAVGRTFYLRPERALGKVERSAIETGESFAVNVPESALRRARNRVEVFEVLDGGELRSIGGA